MWRDLERLGPGEGCPSASPAASRATVRSPRGWRWRGGGAGAPFARAVMSANFAEDREIGEAVIVEILGALGLPAAELMARAQADASKLALRCQTDARSRTGPVRGAGASVSVRSCSGATIAWRMLAWACRADRR